MSKLYPCKKCGTEVPIRSKGLCPMCRENQRRENGEETAMSKKSHIPRITEKTKKKNKERKAIRDVYFDYHIAQCKKSEESNKPIYNPTRANICHILPKGQYPSLQANLDNFVYLTFEEHERFDLLLFSHSFKTLEKEFTNSLPIILKRLKKIIPLCMENKILLQELIKHFEL